MPSPVLEGLRGLSDHRRGSSGWKDYEPSEPWRIQIASLIKPVRQNKKHIQILYSQDQHWVCSYYDGENLFTYDSLNKKGFREGHFEYLRRLFPTYQFDLRP
ncbi:hypothetical protein PV326_010875, partial [Microctonus aethiopoides]